MKMSGTIVLCLVMLQGMLYLAFAHGVDIFGFPGVGSSCKGGAYMCKGIAPNKCCDFDNLGVNRIRWKDLGVVSLGLAYTGGKCAKKLTHGCGVNDRCLKTEGTTGASWKKGCAEPNLLIAGCESSLSPNAVSYIYTEGSSQRTLVLETPNVVDILTKLESAGTDYDKVEFLLAQGAQSHTSAIEDGTHVSQ